MIAVPINFNTDITGLQLWSVSEVAIFADGYSIPCYDIGSNETLYSSVNALQKGTIMNDYFIPAESDNLSISGTNISAQYQPGGGSFSAGYAITFQSSTVPESINITIAAGSEEIA